VINDLPAQREETRRFKKTLGVGLVVTCLQKGEESEWRKGSGMKSGRRGGGGGAKKME